MNELDEKEEGWPTGTYVSGAPRGRYTSRSSKMVNTVSIVPYILPPTLGVKNVQETGIGSPTQSNEQRGSSRGKVRGSDKNFVQL